MIRSADQLINQLVRRRTRATAEQRAAIVERVTAAGFSEALLEVEAALWGGFWQFDVIAPGYQLPAVEVALLRAMRLDQSWPEGTTVEQFLANVRWALQQPPVGVWTLTVAGEPAAVIAGRNDDATLTAAWYCATTSRLHAAYRVDPADFSTPPEAIEQSALPLVKEAKPTNRHRPDWLSEVIEEKRDSPSQDLAARLDIAILALRAGYF